MTSNATRLFVFFFAIFVLSCKKDQTAESPEEEKPLPMEEIRISTGAEASVLLGDSLIIRVEVPGESVYTSEWSIGETVLSRADSLVMRKYKAGTYTVLYRAISGSQIRSKEVKVEVQPVSVVSTEANKMYVTRLLEFMPAPGQFINKAPGNLESAGSLLGKKGMVSLGAWGGYIVLGFDHKVVNTANKHDILIYNNATASFAEPGVVSVMEDKNGNGIADDIWYEIKGSASPSQEYIRNYAVTYIRPNPLTGDVAWKDNKGNTGVVKTNTFHKQSYFPLWIDGLEYTLTGTRLPSNNINMSNPLYITSAPFEHGYADNTSGGDKIDLANAVDANGNSVSPEGVHFIKIQTGIQANMGWLGELSTEVLGVADASLIK